MRAKFTGDALRHHGSVVSYEVGQSSVTAAATHRRPPLLMADAHLDIEVHPSLCSAACLKFRVNDYFAITGAC